MEMTSKLHAEIDDKIDALAMLDVSGKEYSTAVDSVTKLMDRAIEIEKLELSEAHNEKQMAHDEKQLNEDRTARIVKNCIDVGSIVLPLTVTIWGALVSLKFEEEGTITTTIGRKTLDKLFKR